MRHALLLVVSMGVRMNGCKLGWEKMAYHEVAQVAEMKAVSSADELVDNYLC